MISRDEANQVFRDACRERGLSLSPEYPEVLFKVAEWLISELEQGRRVLGMAGAQGTGKSTFAWLLSQVLEVYGKSTIVVSLDDFYLTKAQRRELASVSSLLEVRGVPGTHDLPWCLQTVQAFRGGAAASVPIFSKPEDDRTGEVQVNFANTDLLIFEGWCWGARPQPESELGLAVNELEAIQDPQGKWRAFVNQQLHEYQALFSADLNLMLKAPDFASVLRWRWQQEQGLPKGPASMSKEQVATFIQYYQRITEYLLGGDQRQFDVTIELDTDHRLTIDKFPVR